MTAVWIGVMISGFVGVMLHGAYREGKHRQYIRAAKCKQLEDAHKKLGRL